jgi:hypothetical protein
LNNYDINKLLDFFNYSKKFTHPTEFYNEGWLTRLLIFSITDFGLKEHPLYIQDNSKYFSESLLYTPFLARSRKDSLAESFTHADSAIGEFNIGNDKNKGSLILTGNKLKIFEAKINSGFSKDVTNAKFYNQSARYVACITEIIDRANKISQLDSLSIGFYLILPKEQYEKKKTFKEFLDKINIYETVQKRVEQYHNEDDYEQRLLWLTTTFKNVLDKITIKPIFYENVISELEGYQFHNEINDYYEKCKDYNKIKYCVQ